MGNHVSSVAVGDPVLLSFNHCRTCTHCKASHPGFCQSFVALNTLGEPGRFVNSSSAEVGGKFFGQSSFASLTPVNESCVVNAKDLIKSRDELKLFAPLGCGFQTGSGSMINLGAVDVSSQGVVMGLGGVGLSALMVGFLHSPMVLFILIDPQAAKVQGCRTIIAVDRVKCRLELARSLGATHTLDTSAEGSDLEKDVMRITTEGASVAVDTSGVPALVKAASRFIGNRGKLILVAIMPPDFVLEIHAPQWMTVG